NTWSVDLNARLLLFDGLVFRKGHVRTAGKYGARLDRELGGGNISFHDAFGVQFHVFGPGNISFDLAGDLHLFGRDRASYEGGFPDNDMRVGNDVPVYFSMDMDRAVVMKGPFQFHVRADNGVNLLRSHRYERLFVVPTL